MIDDVKNLCQSSVDPQFPDPPEFLRSFFGQSELWSVLMLCTTAASFPPDQPSYLDQLTLWEPVSDEATKEAKELRACPDVHSRCGVVQASRWIYAVMEAWRSKLRDYHVPGEASAMTGAKLVALVCKHMRAVLTRTT